MNFFGQAQFLSPESALATKLLFDALAPLSEDLQTLNHKLVDYLPTHTTTSHDIIRYIFGLSGKRIRPALFMYCCRLLNYRGSHFFPIAAVSEYIHTASLLHDDVIDSSSLRRNKPTASSVWGDQASVLVGDLIYSKASEMMAETGSIEIVSMFARAIRLMSEGELLQLEHVFDFNISKESYFKILEYKTATLISACCRAAAVLAGEDLTKKQALADFGSYVGMAFQLVDDALDYLGSKELFGKATLSDLAEGKVTLPIILLQERASAVEQDKIRQVLNNNHLSLEDIDYISELVERYHTATDTIKLASEYTIKAKEALTVFPKSEKRDAVENLASQLVWRFN